MQLVRLGEDPTRTLNLDVAPDTETSRAYHRKGLNGKTARGLALMSNRAELVELMEQHLRRTPEEKGPSGALPVRDPPPQELASPSTT